jgi:hypothetical protein
MWLAEGSPLDLLTKVTNEDCKAGLSCLLNKMSGAIISLFLPNCPTIPLRKFEGNYIREFYNPPANEMAIKTIIVRILVPQAFVAPSPAGSSVGDSTGEAVGSISTSVTL